MFSRLTTNILILLAAFAWGYLLAMSHYNEAATIEGLRNEVASLERQIEAQKQDAVLLRQSEQELAELNLKLQEMQNAISDRDRVCLDAADTQRLRNFWPTPATSTR